MSRRFRGTVETNQLKTIGQAVTINSQSVTVTGRNASGLITECYGTVTITDAGAGYAKGCKYTKTDGGVSTTFFINEGSTSSCDFNAMETSASTVTAVVAGDGLSGGGTEGSVTLSVNTDGVGIETNTDALRLKDLGVTTGKIANNAVTLAKIERSDAVGKIPVGQGAASDTVYMALQGDVTVDGGGNATTTKIGGVPRHTQAAPAAKTVTAGITAAELVAGLITTTGVSAPSLHQLPTGTELDNAMTGEVNDQAVDFTIINTGTGASDDATITVNTDVTIVGNPTVGALTDGTIISGSGRFRARRSGTNTWVVYRLA